MPLDGACLSVEGKGEVWFVVCWVVGNNSGFDQASFVSLGARPECKEKSSCLWVDGVCGGSTRGAKCIDNCDANAAT